MLDTIQYMDMICDLPSGGSLYREENDDGDGHRYYSDETGVMLEIWNTVTTSRPTLLMALADDEIRLYKAMGELLDGIS